MHRFTWDLRLPGPLAERHASEGPKVLPRFWKNQVRITAGIFFRNSTVYRD